MTTDRCPECGFLAADWDERDTRNVARGLPHLWRWTLEGPWAESHGSDPALVTCAGAARAAVATAEAVTDVDALRQAIHDVVHAQAAVGRLRDAAGVPEPRAGSVVALGVSDGGVPKHAVPSAVVGWRGVEGDRQAARQHHGRPIQALCLWSAEVIAALRDEGHPIAPGSAGENITVAGLPWATVRPGSHLRIGEVDAVVTAYAEPCTKNAQWFADREFRRIDHDRHPGWSRVYASVRAPGRVTVGDAVVVTG